MGFAFNSKSTNPQNVDMRGSSSSDLAPYLQVKLGVTHHTLSASANDAIQLTAEKPLTFVLDALKQRESGKSKTKKRKKGGGTGGLNTKNFGSVIDISKFKNAQRFVVGWRARCSMGNNTNQNFKKYKPHFCLLQNIVFTKTIPHLGELLTMP